MLRAPHILLAVAGNDPPAEFRIFSAGKVETTKGTFVFDAAAAAAVMGEYQKHGIDLMIDYDHASLASVSIDPAEAGKAAGWFNLEVRGGELWAVNVRWTPAAAAALLGKEWRFMSPAFTTDESGHVTSLLNVAITNMPATRRLEPLIAASAKGTGMTIEEFLKVIKALAIDPTTSLDDALAKIKGEDPDANTEDAPPPAGDGGADEATEASAPPTSPDDDPRKKKEGDAPPAVAASISRFMRLSGKTSIVDAIVEAETWRASHIKLETETQKLAAERAVLEAAQRRKLCVELVTLGGYSPANVWADDKCSAPKTYLSAMPIADLVSMHADAVKANAKKAPLRAPSKGATPAPAESDREIETPHGAVTLSASELAECKRAGAKPEVYAANKALRIKRTSAKGSV